MKPMLALYGHPFSSYTQKVLTALHENGTPYELRNLDPGAPGDHAAEWRRRWPLAQFPLLVDGSRTVVESSIVIEHLQLAHPGPVQLIPAEPAAALEVRFMDRFFDLHVMAPVQHAVNAALTGNADRRYQALIGEIRQLTVDAWWTESVNFLLFSSEFPIDEIAHRVFAAFDPEIDLALLSQADGEAARAIGAIEDDLLFTLMPCAQRYRAPRPSPPSIPMHQ